jgi:hypothetical protein
MVPYLDDGKLDAPVDAILISRKLLPTKEIGNLQHTNNGDENHYYEGF